MFSPYFYHLKNKNKPYSVKNDMKLNSVGDYVDGSAVGLVVLGDNLFVVIVSDVVISSMILWMSWSFTDFLSALMNSEPPQHFL